MNHRTRDIYAFNLLHSSKLAVSSDSGYLISRLVDIESRQSSGQSDTNDFAREVIETYSASDVGFDVARVCLSFCSPFSRKLTIVSAHNTDDRGVENLVPGYHCYVSPQSSLFSVPFDESQFGRIRVYSDIEKVIRSFSSRGLPVQRTIGRLAAAGYRSGLSISLGTGGWGSGLLFLNSKTAGAFDSFEDSDYLSTCILRMVANAALLRSKFNPRSVDPQLSATIQSLNQVPNICEPRKFSELLVKAMAVRFGIEMQVETDKSEKTRFFYPSQTAILLVLKAMESLQFDNLAPIRVSFLPIEPDWMQLQIDFGTRQSKIHANGFLPLASLAESAGFEVSISESRLCLTTQYQNSTDVELKCDYSTYS